MTYSNSDSSTVRPPTSALLARIASRIFCMVMPRSRIRCGSRITLYCLTKPPTLATSATPSALASANFRFQSWMVRVSARFSSFDITAYW